MADFFSALPILLLLVTFVGFSIVMVRYMRSGKSGMSYTDIMQRQVDLFEAQISLQAETVDLIKRQTEALEKIAAGKA